MSKTPKAVLPEPCQATRADIATFVENRDLPWGQRVAAMDRALPHMGSQIGGKYFNCLACTEHYQELLRLTYPGLPTPRPNNYRHIN